MEVKQKRKMKAEKLLRVLSQAWNSTGYDGYPPIAYHVAEVSGLLNEFRIIWDKDLEKGVDNWAKEKRKVLNKKLKETSDKNIRCKYLE